MADRNTYALLSARVYDASPDSPDVNKIFVPTGWTELPELVDNGLTGLYARAYRNDATGEIVIAFRGTNVTLTDGTVQDWATNLAAGLGIPNGQVAQAMSFYESIKATYGSNVSFTGHSLGGGIASLMAVFFNKQAAVFDEAPFQLTAINPLTVAAYAVLAPSALLDPDFLLYQLNPLSMGLIFNDREENVTNYFLEGEAVDIIRTDLNTIVGSGDNLIYRLGLSTAGAIDRHDMLVLTAAQYSRGFLKALEKLPNLLTQLLDENLYAADRASSDQDILSLLLRHQFGDGNTVLADGMLDGFARDLNQLTPGGLIKDAPRLEDALITALLQGYDKLEVDRLPFTTDFYNGIPGGFYFDVNRIATSFNQIRTASDLVTAIQTYYGLDTAIALNGFDRWYLQAGATSLIAQDTEGKNDLMAGGSQADVLQGGAGDDLLLGGQGTDIYQYRPNDGNDTIIDNTTGPDTGDGKGIIVYDPDGQAQALAVGLRKDTDPAGQYKSPDNAITYYVSGADLTIATSDGTITVKDFNQNNNDLNIRLLDLTEPTTSHEIKGDLHYQDFDPRPDVSNVPSADSLGLAPEDYARIDFAAAIYTNPDGSVVAIGPELRNATTSSAYAGMPIATGPNYVFKSPILDFVYLYTVPTSTFTFGNGSGTYYVLGAQGVEHRFDPYTADPATSFPGNVIRDTSDPHPGRLDILYGGSENDHISAVTELITSTGAPATIISRPVSPPPTRITIPTMTTSMLAPVMTWRRAASIATSSMEVPVMTLSTLTLNPILTPCSLPARPAIPTNTTG